MFDPPSNNVAKMQALASIGLPRKIIGALVDELQPGRITPDDRRFLQGPLIIHENGWTDTLPRWMSEQVGVERIGIVFGATPQYIVGPTEIAAVMYPASLAAALDRDHAELYMWATVLAYAKWKDMAATDCFLNLMGMEPIPDSAVLVPSGRLFRVYQRLALDIRSRVIAAEMGREREQRREQKTETKPAAPTGPISEQVSLFGEE